ncbi:hypothetical protein KIN20_006565 [Parelaphostrongylus tenuis]|uniref:Uncharacterized protein n=1 Tax=Parelaphostrongylus tenuis TaxID=148309 RepID=A0AAD5M1Y0_PARTN|nr:hypothetical protein KIN20_006565 [Parelaphostrongylus tenuis]
MKLWLLADSCVEIRVVLSSLVSTRLDAAVYQIWCSHILLTSGEYNFVLEGIIRFQLRSNHRETMKLTSRWWLSCLTSARVDF